MFTTYHSTESTHSRRGAMQFRLRGQLAEIKIDRATALGLAFCVNAAVMLGLSLPSQGDSEQSFLVPEPAPVFEVDIQPQPTAQEFEIPPEPVPPSLPQVEPQPVIQPIITESTSMSIPVEPISPISDPAATELSHATEPNPGPPLSTNREAGVAYGSAPPPVYPRDALRKGLQGTVLLRVLVSKTGSVLDVQIDQGSGHLELDRAARKQVASRWRFQPALRDGQPVEAWVRVPLVFKLQRS
ncbi:energy transducer TonB [Pseudomarimonas arenosa]|uniref:Energy transducer TonB n=1 Tax=Pseudomarimonas arenosa TaxID=2774145 RepID=A0AAW3ZNY2_9GAMM|nr:energy transducer TonB [Pseudomarimonas arenosa]MBD8527850.1 energy transducer TonB [Pseudomarimonas arenosa]